MSAIPPHVAASVLQSGVAQQVQSQEKDASDNARANTARKTSGTSFDDVLEVEATDSDTQVHADSGGLGSQGRHDAPPEEEAEEEATEVSDSVTVDSEGQPHLDLSA